MCCAHWFNPYHLWEEYWVLPHKSWSNSSWRACPWLQSSWVVRSGFECWSLDSKPMLVTTTSYCCPLSPRKVLVCVCVFVSLFQDLAAEPHREASSKSPYGKRGLRTPSCEKQLSHTSYLPATYGWRRLVHLWNSCRNLTVFHFRSEFPVVFLFYSCHWETFYKGSKWRGHNLYWLVYKNLYLVAFAWWGEADYNSIFGSRRDPLWF